MRSFLVIIALSQCATQVTWATEVPKKTSCRSKQNIATEYIEWKRDYQNLVSTFDGLSNDERFDTSKDAIRTVLEKMRIFSKRTAIPLPKETYSQARALLKEVEAGSIARLSAIPILKSSLKALEKNMDEMLNKAQWEHPGCKISVSLTAAKRN